MDDTHLRQLRVIYLSLLTGATLFAAVVVFIAFVVIEPKQPTADQVHVANVVSLAAGVLAIVAWKSARFVFRRMVTPAAGSAAPTSGRLKQAYITRLTIYEAAAFAGLAAFLIDGMFGVVRQNPIYALMLTPYITFFTVSVSTFPTPKSVQALLDGLRA